MCVFVADALTMLEVLLFCSSSDAPLLWLSELSLSGIDYLVFVVVLYVPRLHSFWTQAEYSAPDCKLSCQTAKNISTHHDMTILVTRFLAGYQYLAFSYFIAFPCFSFC